MSSRHSNIWHHHGRHFDVPVDHELPEGPFELRRALVRAFVDEAAVLPFEVSAETSKQGARQKIEAGADGLASAARSWLDAHPETQGRGRELLEAITSAVPPQGSAQRVDVAEALAAGFERFAAASRDPARTAALRERLDQAHKQHLADNAQVNERAQAFREGVLNATPDLAAAFAQAGQQLQGISDKLAASAVPVSNDPSPAPAAEDASPIGAD